MVSIPLPSFSLCCRSPPSPHSPSKTLTLISCNYHNRHVNLSASTKNNIKNLLLRSIAGALAFTVISSPPLPSLAIEATFARPSDPSQSELCREEDEAMEEERPSESITNEELVEEAWEVVNDSYIGDVGNRPWSPEIWKVVLLS